ncbi:MAG: hypothetical protein AAFR51_18540 [Pseudomonadota bacterium]
MASSLYVTNGGRVIVALLVGALIGTLPIAIMYGIDVFRANGIDYFLEFGVRNTFSGLVFGTFVWFLCLGIFGGPVWIFLHLSGGRYWWIAALTGFVVPFCVLIIQGTGFFTGRSGSTTLRRGGVDIVIDGHLTQAGWIDAIQTSVVFGALGGIVATVIWRIAYRKNPVQ